ncbi:MAG: DUF5694 domain-containing protein [Bacteroidota bacterium]
MNRLLILLIFLTTNQLLTAQKKAAPKANILLSGTMHYLPDSQRQNWESYREFLEQYKPDAICIEYRIPGDTASLMQADGKRYQLIIDSLRKAWHINIPDEKARIKELYALLKQGEDWKKRIELYQLLYLDADFGNSNFQAWRAYHLIAAMPDKEKEKIRLESPHFKSIEFVARYLRNNEYGNIVFPLAVKFNIDYLYPVDDRTYNARFSIAFQDGSEKMTGTKFEEKWKAAWEQFTKEETEEKKKGNALMFINSDEWQERANYVQASLYLESGNRYYKDYVRYWHLRNKKVSESVLNSIEKSGAQRTVVFMGYLHIYDMKKNLSKKKNIVLESHSK